ncbi:MAG: HEPN domain-containing protein [Magnetococcales bacterium]|nr:HEPN domain-containing protein [Magnetococcales bacterium]
MFGFHAQQAIEKSLKAWLTSLKVAYPNTHDLHLLLVLLAENKQDLESMWDILEFTPFAVQLRYDWNPDEENLDRDLTTKRVNAILNLVKLNFSITSY